MIDNNMLYQFSFGVPNILHIAISKGYCRITFFWFIDPKVIPSVSIRNRRYAVLKCDSRRTELNDNTQSDG